MQNQKETIHQLRAIANELKTRIESVLKTIEILEEVDISIETSSDPGYDKTWDLAHKFYYLIEREGRFLHPREAASLIIELEGGDLRSVTGSISACIRKLRTSGKIAKYQAGLSLSSTFWGLPEWLDSDGKILEGYEINLDYLRKGKKVS